VVGDERRINDDRRRNRLVYACDKDVQLMTTGMCRLTDHVVRPKSSSSATSRETCVLLTSSRCMLTSPTITHRRQSILADTETKNKADFQTTSVLDNQKPPPRAVAATSYLTKNSLNTCS